MIPPLNDGSRPSRLAQARALTGEDPAFPAETIDRDFAAALAATTVAPFDFDRLVARAALLSDAPAPIDNSDPVGIVERDPQQDTGIAGRRDAARVNLGGESPTRRRLPPGRWTRWIGGAVTLCAAALALFFVIPQDPNRLKGGTSDLGFYVQRGSNVFPGDPSNPLQTGDAVQFTYRSTADHLILLSVDADGVVSVFWPARGDEPVAITPGERHVLDGSVVLDDAPSPEVFVGFFGDWTVEQARERAADAFIEGGVDAVAALGDSDSVDIATLSLEKLD